MGFFSCDFELDTLPLLFSAVQDFDMYYSALITKHRGNTKELLDIRQYNLISRTHRDSENFESCLHVLRKCVDLRRYIFEDDDYQFYAAVVHYLLTILYFAASYLSNRKLVEAYTHFSLAHKSITEYANILSRSDTNLLKCILYNNWANYWVTKGKWNAASQCSCKSYQLWLRVTDLSENVLAYLCPFLIARFAASLLFSKKPQDSIKVYSQYLHLLSIDSGDTEKPPSPIHEDEDTLTVNITTLSLLDPNLDAGGPQSRCCLRSLSISLSPSNKENERNPFSTNWPIHASSLSISYYNYGVALLQSRSYKQASHVFERSSVIYQKSFASTGIKGNNIWWTMLQRAYEHACLAQQEKTSSDFRMKVTEYRKEDLFETHRMLCSEAMKAVLPSEELPPLKSGPGGVFMNAAQLKEFNELLEKADPATKEHLKMWRDLVIPSLTQGHDYGKVAKEIARAQSALDVQAPVTVRELAISVARHKKNVEKDKRRQEWETFTKPEPSSAGDLFTPDLEAPRQHALGSGDPNGTFDPPPPTHPNFMYTLKKPAVQSNSPDVLKDKSLQLSGKDSKKGKVSRVLMEHQRKQTNLRAILPMLDPHSSIYHLVNQQLSENEKSFTHLRKNKKDSTLNNKSQLSPISRANETILSSTQPDRINVSDITSVQVQLQPSPSIPHTTAAAIALWQMASVCSSLAAASTPDTIRFVEDSLVRPLVENVIGIVEKIEKEKTVLNLLANDLFEEESLLEVSLAHPLGGADSAESHALPMRDSVATVNATNTDITDALHSQTAKTSTETTGSVHGDTKREGNEHERPTVRAPIEGSDKNATEVPEDPNMITSHPSHSNIDDPISTLGGDHPSALKLGQVNVVSSAPVGLHPDADDDVDSIRIPGRLG